MNKFLLILAFLISFNSAFSQEKEYTTKNKKAITLFENALKNYESGRDAENPDNRNR